jgi:acyl-CoA synthetase (AMP-forming)/AMP-acid ligase II
LEAAAVGVPDKRLGEVVAAIVCVKPAFRGQVSEEDVIAGARQKFVFNNCEATSGLTSSLQQSSQIRTSCHGSHTRQAIRYANLCEQVVRHREGY